MRVPWTVKVAQTVFVLVVIPIYWRYYGPANFLWFSDIALLASVPALWAESALLASTQAVSITLFEMVWLADFLTGLVGFTGIGLAAYMFDESIPMWLRGLSLFHLWLPLVYLWLVYRLGYDRRAFAVQTPIGETILVCCYFFTSSAQNINWVFGPSDRPQTSLPPRIYLLLVMIAFPTCVYWPTHWALRKLMSRRS